MKKLVLEIDYLEAIAKSNFDYSLHKSGFSIIKNHPIEWDLIDNLYKKWSIFFNSEEKFAYPCNAEKPEGFFPINLEPGMEDLKECFYFYPLSNCPKYLYKITMAVYNNLLILAEELLSWLIDRNHSNLSKEIANKIKRSIHTAGGALRILHYPALHEISSNVVSNAKVARLIPHKDISLLTLLPVATSPGLEILDNYGEWHTIKCNPETLIVNSGDMLSDLTNDYFKSTVHRVSVFDKFKWKPRYSCAFFLNIDKGIY